MLERFDGWHKPEGLPLYLWCVQSLSRATPTPLTERSMIARVHRPWLMCTKLSLHDLSRMAGVGCLES